MQRAFLVGAGISVDPPANFPAAWQLSSLILAAIAPDKKDLPFLENLIDSSRAERKNFGDYIRFEQLLEAVASNLDADLGILRYFGRFKEPNDFHLFFARQAIAGHVLTTTNFDGLLEEALLRLGALPRSLLAKSEFRSWKAAKNSGVPVFKLHGSFERYHGSARKPAFSSMQATLAAVAQGAKGLSLPKEKSQFLADCLRDHELWVVGYSGSDDLDIMPTLCSLDCAAVNWIEHDGRAKPEDVTAAVLHRLEGLPEDTLSFRERFLRNHGRRHPDRLRILRGPTREILSTHLGPIPASAPKPSGDHLRALQKHFSDWHARFASDPAKRHLLVADLLVQIGMIEEGKAYIERAWSLLKPGDFSRAKASYMMSRILVREGLPKEAAGWSLRAIRSLGKRHAAIDRIRTYHQHAYSLYKCGQWKRSRSFHRRVERMAASIGSQSWLSIALHDQGLILQDRGRYKDAVTLYQRSFRLSMRSGDIQHASWSLYQLAVCSYEQARFAQAYRYLERSNTIAKTIGDANHIGFIEQLLGLIDLLAGRLSMALLRLRRCLEIDRRTRYSEFTGMDLLHLGIVFLEIGRQDRAGYLFSLADKEFTKASDEETRSELRAFQAQLALERSDFMQAEIFARQAIELAEAAMVPGYLYRARCITGLIRWKAGDPRGMEMAEDALLEASGASLLTLVLDLFPMIRRICPGWEVPRQLKARHRWAQRVYGRLGNRPREGMLR